MEKVGGNKKKNYAVQQCWIEMIGKYKNSIINNNNNNTNRELISNTYRKDGSGKNKYKYIKTHLLYIVHVDEGRSQETHLFVLLFFNMLLVIPHIV